MNGFWCPHLLPCAQSRILVTRTERGPVGRVLSVELRGQGRIIVEIVVQERKISERC